MYRKLLVIFLIAFCLLSGDNQKEKAINESNIVEIASQVYFSNRHGTTIVAVIDFNIPETQKRFFIVDVRQQKIIYSTYVAHGQGSGHGPIPSYFSNKEGSHASSLGVYITSIVYYGDNGKSLKIKGLSKTNSNAEKRLIVIHGADYVGSNKHGHSWGCFAVPMQDRDTVLQLLGEGSLVYAFK